MADVRSLLKNERAARRIHHKHATYTTGGTLLCTVCNFQIKAESLWEGHLGSAGHSMRLSELQDKEAEANASGIETIGNEINSKKRKASDENETEDTMRKRSRASDLPQKFLDKDAQIEADVPMSPMKIDVPSPAQPLTSAKPVEEAPKQASVDEDEWAAFEADIAAAEAPAPSDAVISAPAMSAAEVQARSIEESNAQKKQRQEAEIEGDKEDAARKLETEFEEMEGLQERVKRLREKREALRVNSGTQAVESTIVPTVDVATTDPFDEDDMEDDDEDDWDGFRLRV